MKARPALRKRFVIFYFELLPNLDPEALTELLEKALEIREDLDKQAEELWSLYHVPASVNIIEPSLSASREAFKVNYDVDNSKPMEVFERFFEKDIMEAFNDDKNRFHSAYFAVVQSSGYGKSRMLLELARQSFNTVYMCLRDSKSTGYPVGNLDVATFLLENNSIRKLEIFIAVTYLYALNLIEDSEEAFPLKFLIGDESDVKFTSFWSFVVGYCREVFKDNNSASSLLLKYRFAQSEFQYKHYSKRHGGRLDGGLSELLIVIDEASFLLAGDADSSLFRNLRRAHRNLGSQNCFILFVDTLSSVSNFVPASVMDPSYRGRIRYNLLPPFYELTTFHDLSLVDHEILIGDLVNDIDRRVLRLHIRFATGRPLWYSLFFSEGNLDKTIRPVVNALELATRKLAFSEAKDISTCLEATLAVLCIRFGINGILDHTLASRLMSSFMGTGMYIGPDRLRMMVQYVPEPILAEAACQLLHGEGGLKADGSKSITKFTFNVQSLAQMVVKLADKWVSGTIDVGKLGELFGRIILSLAYDYVKLDGAASEEEKNEDISSAMKRLKLSRPKVDGSNDLFTDPITLEQFLDALVSEEYRGKYKSLLGAELLATTDSTFLNGTIVLTGWVSLYRLPGGMMSQEVLRQAYQLGVGITMPESFKGIDALIPVRKTDGYFSFVLVQNKLKQAEDFSIRLVDAGRKMTPEYCFSSIEREDGAIMSSEDFIHKGDYVAIYMDVGLDSLSECFPSGGPSKKQKADFGDFQESFPNHILLVGLEYPFFKDALLKDTMKYYRRHQVESMNAGKRAAVLEKMSSLGFKFARRSCQCKTVCTGNCGCRRSGACCKSNCTCPPDCPFRFNPLAKLIDNFKAALERFP